MKRKSLCLFLTSLFIFSYINVYAECSYKEQNALKSEAANIKAVYEEQTDTIIDSSDGCEYNSGCTIDYNYFDIKLINMNKNFYVKVANNINSDKNTYTFDALKDGIITFSYKDIDKIATFTFDIYTSDNTSCSDEKIRTMKLVTPRLNPYANQFRCKDYPEYYLCQKYVTFEEMSYYDFVDKMANYEQQEEKENIKKEEKNKNNSILNFIKKHKRSAIVILLAIIVTVGGAVYIFSDKKGNKK